MQNEEHQWYTNRELFEMLHSMNKDFADLRLEMRETRNLIKSYNGLREELEKMRNENELMKTQVQAIVSKDEGMNRTLDNVRQWGGWIFALVTLFILLYNQIA